MPSAKSFHRTDRVSAQLRREVGQLVHQAVREHGLPSMSVSDVEVSRDLAHAKVFVTALQAERAAEGVKALRELARELRFQLGRMLRMRSVPELHFHYDDSVDRGERIDSLLRDVDDGGAGEAADGTGSR
ncbi:30S ribosome-binding factor RbfA [Coralloluteibacterium stylophorae]|uniref:Ribosome-binding factor A n=1 Tax=Coralloluteibacterium stylophorae TaxID=1776034 RepID=A0A8J7VXF2_9GAMM|nr:30S ribosome-binding factor RbfA [Coralloluteibacterium stylophorae]MBS7457583.1 30S ribosome-binding factor RbfA [Coralloluteibacterium stylophorae]